MKTISKYSINPRWNLEMLHDEEINGDGITVAILDSSINKNHIAFANTTLNGKNYIDGKPDDYWCSNRELHGTMVAGIVAKTAPKAEIFMCCVAEDKSFKCSAIIKALEYIRDEKECQVIIMSFGGPPLTAEEEEKKPNDKKVKYRIERKKLINELVGKGGVCVAAVGNDGLFGDGIASPACLPNVIAVGGLDKDGSRLNNPGQDQIDVYAPGEMVSSPSANNNSNYLEGKGSSCAAPAIGGIVALLMQQARECGVQVSNIELLKKLFSHMTKKIDGCDVLSPKEFFLEHGRKDKFKTLVEQLQ